MNNDPDNTLLRSALINLRPFNKQGLARSAGVSPLAVTWLLDSKYNENKAAAVVDETGNIKPFHQWSTKQRRGYVEPLARLAKKLGVNVACAVEEYLLEPNSLGSKERKIIDTVVNESVEEMPEAPSERRSLPLQNQTGALERIKANNGLVKGEVLRWPPFVDHDCSKAITDSWAWRYVSALIGTLNPLWSIDEPNGIGDIDAAIKNVQSGQSDFMFGLYDTLDRRICGLDFINVPGFSTQLSALYFLDASYLVENKFRFDELYGDGREISAVVFRKEIGHLFLAGCCGFGESGSNKKKLMFVEGDVSAAHGGATAAAVKMMTERANKNFPVFVGDRTMCNLVRAELSSSDMSWLNVNPLCLNPPEIQNEYKRMAANTTVTDYSDVAPTYRIGIAVAANDIIFADFLRRATVELFRTAPDFAASIYQGALSVPGIAEIRPAPFLQDMDTISAQNFWKSLEGRCRSIKEFERFSAEWSKDIPKEKDAR